MTDDEESTSEPTLTVGELSDADRAKAQAFRYTVLIRADDGNEQELGTCEGRVVVDNDDAFALALQRSVVETLKKLVEEMESW